MDEPRRPGIGHIHHHLCLNFRGINRASLIAALFLGCALSLPCELQAYAVGYTTGQFAVDPTGAATYRIPIQVPPGVRGLQPELALLYHSRAGNGQLGMGWSLAGLSAITRCPRSIAQDGAIGGVHFDTDDRFCLDGQRLVMIGSGRYGSAGSYRTEIESFQDIQSQGAAGNGPQNFVVRDRSGLRREYGTTTDSRPLAMNGAARLWLLASITDRYGNFIHYRYDNPGGEPTVVEIVYGNGRGSTLAKVAFNYQSRPDRVSRYLAGEEFASNQRLVQINTHAAGAQVKSYTLGYAEGRASSRSQLISVTECDSTNDCLAPLGFGWQQSLAGFSENAEQSPLPARMDYLQVGDFDSDGIPDYLYLSNGIWYLRLGKNPGIAINTGLRLQNGDQPEYSLVADMNGDGCADLVTANNSRGWYVWYSNCDGTLRASQQGNRPSYNAQDKHPLLVDLNGDGYPELVFKYISSYSGNVALAYYFNGPAGLAPAITQTALIVSYGQKLIPVNFFGNGTPDIYVTRADDCNDANRLDGAGGTKSSTSSCAQTEGILTWNGSALVHAELSARDMAYAKDPLFLDLNGDGLSDMLSPQCFPRCQWQAYMNRGGAWSAQSVTLIPSGEQVGEEALRYARAVDYNGDGLSDLMYPDINGRWSVLLSNGKTFGPRQDTGLPSSGYPNTLFVDYHGNGWADMLYFDGRWRARARGLGIMPDLMQRVTQGTGREALVQHTVSYLPLSDLNWRPVLYSGHSGSVNPPTTRHFMGALYVVRSFASHTGYDSSGRPIYVTNYYRYAGAKLNQQGRGFLGFATLETANTNTSIVTRTTYRQDFPYTGMVARALQYISSLAPTGTTSAETQGQKICRLPNGEQDLCPDSPPRAANSILDQPPGRLVTQSDNDFSADVPPLGTAGESRFAYVRTSTVRNYDLVNGALYRRAVTGYLYDSHGNPTSVTERTDDGTGAGVVEVTTTNAYAHDNVANWCLGLRNSSRTVRAFNNVQHTSQYTAEHDAEKCDLIAETTEPGNAALELISRYGFDEFGNRVAVTLSGASFATRTSRTEFDSQGVFPMRRVNPLGHTETRTWHPAFGTPLSLRDPNGTVTRWTYDGFGRKTLETGPYPDQKTTWARSWCASSCRRADSAYKIVASGDDGARIATEYDALGRAVFSAHLSAEINGTAKVIDEDTYFDPLGRPYLVSRPYFDGSTTRCWEFREYDNLNRLRRELQAARAQECTTETPTLSSPPAYGRLNQYDYTGLQTTVTDPLGRRTTRLDNLLGKPASMTDADHHSTYYEYDPLGNPVKITDANGNVLRTTYDPAGHKTEMWDPDMGHWTYTYDALGQLLRQTDAKGQTLTQRYDSLGRLTQRTEAEGITRWTYDIAAGAGLGRLAYVSRDDGYWEGYAYDDYGAPTDKVTIINNREYRLSTTYDNFGRVDSIAYPDINVRDAGDPPTGAPPALNAPSSTSGKFDITWTVATDGGMYHLYRAPDQGASPAPDINAREIYSGARGLYHENLSEPNSYRYWLNVCHAQKCSAAYSTATVAVGRPAAPGNFQVRADRDGSDGRYTASWDAVEGAANYKLFHAASGGIAGSQIYSGSALSQPLDLDDGDHYYQLQACAPAGCSPYASAGAGIHVLKPPGPPTLSAPASSADGRYAVSWSAPADPIHVKYYRLQEAVNSDWAAATTTTENAATMSRTFSHPVNGNTAYHYRVQACNQDGGGSTCGAYSNTGMVKVVPPPGTPVNFSIPGTSNTGNFRIGWKDGAGGTPESYAVSSVVDICEYDYETRKNNCSRLPSGNSITVTAPYADITGLKDGTYQYTVQACNASGCSTSAYAGAVVVTLLTGTPAGLATSASTSTDGNYLLSWGAATGSPTSYQLFEAVTADFSNQVQIFAGNELTSSITGKSPNGTYYYRVRACNSAGCSAYTNPVSVQVAVLPGAPSGLSASTATSTDGSYRLGWGIAPGSPASYQLFEATVADFGNQTQIYNGNSIAWTISGKTPNANYYYRARACNSAGCGPYTSTVSVKVAVPPGMPVNVSMPASSSSGNFRITWSAGAGGTPTSYTVAGTTDQCEYDYETRRNICWRLPGGGDYTVSTPYADITGLQDGTYYYTVSACDGTGCSPSASAGSIKVSLPPGLPAGISASASSTTTGNYSVSWGTASGSPTSYQLFESTNPGFSGETQVYAGSARTWSISGKAPNGTYYYRARACNSTGCSAHTNAVQVQVSIPVKGGGIIRGCSPRLPVCDWIPEDNLVLAPRPPGPNLSVAATNRLADAAQQFPTTETPPSSTQGLIRHPVLREEQPLSPLATSRKRYADLATVLPAKSMSQEYSVAPALHYFEGPGWMPLRQDGHIRYRFRKQEVAPLPQFELAASSKPAATYTHMVKYTYDKTGHLSQIHEIRSDETIGMRYWAVADTDAAGHITGEVFGNNMARARGYDSATGLQTGVNSGTRNATLQDENYEWDNAGNLRLRNDAITGLSENFDYDNLDRLIRVRTVAPGVGVEAAATYDAVGNLQSRDGIGRYAYDGSPYTHAQPHAVRALVGPDGARRTYSYDANGNMTSGTGRAITWTTYNKPNTINNTAFSYAPDRTLISRSQSDENGSIYAGQLFEAVASPGGSMEYKMYIYAGSELVAVHMRASDGSASTHYPLQDHLGSTALLADEQGREIDGSRLSYDAWGRARPVTGSNAYRSPVLGQAAPGIPGRPLGYTGHLNMDSLGLIHMGGRVYDPELGRMASPDPSVQFPLNSQGFNRYSYVNNNPLSYTDPSGYFTFGQLAKMVAIAFVSYYTAGWVTNAWMTAGTSSAAAGSGAAATAAGGATAGTNAVATSSTTASLAAGGGATGTSAATVTLSGQMIGGATGGFVGGALYTGDLRGGLNGAFAGAVFGGIDFGYSGQWNLSRVAVHTLAGGSIAEIEGGKFMDGALFAGAGALARYGYNKYVGYDVDPRSGNGVEPKPQGEDEKYPMPVPGKNNVGTDWPSKEQPPTLWQEGGAVSKALNVVPTVNAIAGPHDVVMRSIMNRFGDGTIANAINVPLMLPATIFTWAAFVGTDPSRISCKANHSCR